jgi:hypothetical protein
MSSDRKTIIADKTCPCIIIETAASIERRVLVYEYEYPKGFSGVRPSLYDNDRQILSFAAKRLYLTLSARTHRLQMIFVL